jgi:hypothetical protein
VCVRACVCCVVVCVVAWLRACIRCCVRACVCGGGGLGGWGGGVCDPLLSSMTSHHMCLKVSSVTTGCVPLLLLLSVIDVCCVCCAASTAALRHDPQHVCHPVPRHSWVPVFHNEEANSAGGHSHVLPQDARTGRTVRQHRSVDTHDTTAHRSQPLRAWASSCQTPQWGRGILCCFSSWRPKATVTGLLCSLIAFLNPSNVLLLFG